MGLSSKFTKVGRRVWHTCNSWTSRRHSNSLYLWWSCCLFFSDTTLFDGEYRTRSNILTLHIHLIINCYFTAILHGLWIFGIPPRRSLSFTWTESLSFLRELCLRSVGILILVTLAPNVLFWIGNPLVAIRWWAWVSVAPVTAPVDSTLGFTSAINPPTQCRAQN